MLREDRMKLMIGLARFEKREGKKMSPADRYFRGDYISTHLLISLLTYTFCFALCILIWLLYNSEMLLSSLDPDLLIPYAVRGSLIYAAGLLVYLVITAIVYNRRYEYAVRAKKVYVSKLKRLERRYEASDRAKETTKEGSRHDGASRT